eukprot:9557353-Heterocapsa_arctica.AAC.1
MDDGAERLGPAASGIAPGISDKEFEASQQQGRPIAVQVPDTKLSAGEQSIGRGEPIPQQDLAWSRESLDKQMAFIMESAEAEARALLRRWEQ